MSNKFWSACTQGNIKQVKLLIDEIIHDELILFRLFSNLYPFIETEEYLEKLTMLLGHEIDVNETNNVGNTLLFYAVGEENLDFVNVLVEHGADVNVNGYNGDTPLICAIKNGDLNIANVLIEHGADINAKNDFGNTSLMYASDYGYLEVIKYLVDHGADLYAINYSDDNALMIASDFQEFEIVEYFQELGIQKIKNIFSRFYIQLFMKKYMLYSPYTKCGQNYILNVYNE